MREGGGTPVGGMTGIMKLGTFFEPQNVINPAHFHPLVVHTL
jgi:hypothetical protein